MLSHRPRRGIVLVICLSMLVVTMMVAAVLLQLSLTDMSQSTHAKERLRALEMAQAGIQHTLHELTYNPAFQGRIERQADDLSYLVSFEPAVPARVRSTNNLLVDGPCHVTGAVGRTIYGKQVEIISTGSAGNVQVRVRALAVRGFAFNRGIGCQGTFDYTGTGLTLDGIQSLANNNPADGGIYSSKDGNGPAPTPVVNFSGPVNFLNFSRVETPQGLANVSGLPPAQQSRVSQLSGNNAKIPEFDVAKVVNNKFATVSAQPVDMIVAGNGYSMPSSVINDERKVPGNLTVNGDLNLADGTLFIKGDLTINGGVLGVGTVFCDGNVTINGGTSVLVTNQSSGAAVFASHDVTMQGIDTEGHLQQIAASHPGSQIMSKFATFQTALSNLENRVNSNNADQSAAAFVEFSRNFTHIGDPNRYWINPIPGPSGLRALSRDTSPVPALLTELRSTVGAGMSGDLRAQKIARSFEQIAYMSRSEFRFTDIGPSQLDRKFGYGSSAFEAGITPGAYQDTDYPHVIGLDTGRGPYDSHYAPGTPFAHRIVNAGGAREISLHDGSSLLPLPRSNQWHDPFNPARFLKDDRQGWDTNWESSGGTIEELFPFFRDMTIDHQAKIMTYGTSNPIYTAKIRDQFMGSMRSFVANHPADLSWLSRSAFQGMVYAGGDVRLGGSFDVTGAILARGDVRLNGQNFRVIYNQEYFRQRGSIGPLSVTNLEVL